ncbi:unnamed protein product [Camellia sinensis]
MKKEYLELCKSEINTLLQKKLIRSSRSPWSCTAFYVNKNAEIERGVPRLAINYKPLNEALQRISIMVKAASENPGTPSFPDGIVSRFPGLKSGRFWKEHHDLLLLRAVLKSLIFSGACQTSHWKSGHKTKCKDFQLSGQVKSMQSAYMQHGWRDSSAVALVPSSGTVNITKLSKEDFVELFNWDKRGFPPCGLLHRGNSCFANVVLQCLVYTRPLVAYLLEKGHRKECRRNDWCFLCEFQTHVKRSSESWQPFSPINILSRLPNIGGDLAMENKRMRMSS